MAKSSRKHTRADRSTPYPGAPPREIAAEMSAIATAIKATEKSADIAESARAVARGEKAMSRHGIFLASLAETRVRV